MPPTAHKGAEMATWAGHIGDKRGSRGRPRRPALSYRPRPARTGALRAVGRERDPAGRRAGRAAPPAWDILAVTASPGPAPAGTRSPGTAG